jgi:hypothetical protein
MTVSNQSSQFSSSRPNRRGFMKYGAMLAGGTIVIRTASACEPLAQDTEKDTIGEIPEEAEFLFVQSAASATLAEGVLTLNKIAPTTIFFTDRPQRIVGHVETEHLLEAMAENKNPDSFEKDPPNATLSVLSHDEVTEVVMTLGKPRLDGDVLTYPVKILDGMEKLEGGPVSLFIDPIGRPRSPGSIGGVHRRRRRRVIRR